MNDKEREDSLTLGILEAIEERSDVTQRHLARRLDVALGLTNAYLRRCVRKGLVKIHQAPANRYLYYLTPRGFSEKTRLTGEYLSSSLGFYRRASDSCKEALRFCSKREWRRVLVCGTTELAEIATLWSSEHGIDIIGFHEPDSDKTAFLGRPVFPSVEDAGPFDACILADHLHIEERCRSLGRHVAAERVLVPDVLGTRPRDRHSIDAGDGMEPGE